MQYKADGVPLVILARTEYGAELKPRSGRQGILFARRAHDPGTSCQRTWSER